MVDLDDFVQIANDDLRNFMESSKVVFATRSINESGQCKRSQIADCNLVGCGIFDDLGTEIGGLNSAEVLLVTLAVASIFIKYIRSSGFGLSFNDRIP